MGLYIIWFMVNICNYIFMWVNWYIWKWNKNHKVSFIDMISSQRIAEVILIDNSSSVFENNNNNDDKENC